MRKNHLLGLAQDYLVNENKLNNQAKSSKTQKLKIKKLTNICGRITFWDWRVGFGLLEGAFEDWIWKRNR
jgi:hypothetical protein